MQRPTPLRAPARPTLLRRIGKRLLMVYWASCVAVIALGLNELYPDVRPALATRFAGPDAVAPEVSRGPSAAPTRAFRSCTEAHAAGVFDIPAGSPAYSPRQDGDGDGLACEPY